MAELTQDVVATKLETTDGAESEKSATERTRELLESMGLQRQALLEILQACEQRASAGEVETVIANFEQSHKLVYSAASLCAMLEHAGALERVDENGQPIADEPAQAVEVEEDSEEYLTVAQPIQTYWVATAAGTEVLSEHNPQAQTAQMFADDDPKYLPVYKYILETCADGVKSVGELGLALDEHELLAQAKPRVYAVRFVEKLEQCEALSWNKGWHTTKVGKQALSTLASVEALDLSNTAGAQAAK